MVTSSKRAYATCLVTQVCCTESHPCNRPLLTCAATGDTQTLKGRSDSDSVGSVVPGVHKVLFEPSKHPWWIRGLILNAILPLLPSFWGFSLALGCGVSFYDGIQHSPVNGCSAASGTFGVLAGDEHMSFYSTVLCSPLKGSYTIVKLDSFQGHKASST